MSGIWEKITRHAKEQKNMTHKRKKKYQPCGPKYIIDNRISRQYNKMLLMHTICLTSWKRDWDVKYRHKRFLNNKLDIWRKKLLVH